MVQLYSRIVDEFLVDTSTQGAQGSPSIAALPDGSFIIAWADASGQGGDASGYAIKAQRLDASGHKVGAEVRINTATQGDQFDPTVTVLPSGKILVTWSDNSGQGGDASSFGVKGQLLAVDLSPIGGEFLVNTTTASNQYIQSVTGLAGGGFVVTWTDTSNTAPDTSVASVKAQIFDASAARVGSEFMVNTTTNGSQRSPAVIGLPSGGFATVWSDSSLTGGDTSSFGIRLQLFDAAGARVGGEQRVNTTTFNAQYVPSIALLQGGGFVVTWTDESRSDLFEDNAGDIRAQIFDAAGQKIGGELLVNTTSTGSRYFSQVVGLPDGGFMVAWDGTESASGGSTDIMAQVFDAAGAKVGTEFLVNTITAGTQNNPSLALLSSGDIALTWNDFSGIGGDSDLSAIKAIVIAPGAGGPTDLQLSNLVMSETSVENLSVGALTSTGAINTSFVYSIISDSTGGAFALAGDKLVVVDNGKLDFETAPTAQLRIRTTDLSGNAYEENVTLQIADAAVEARYTALAPFSPAHEAGVSQAKPQVAALSDGRSVMVWQFYSADAPHGQIIDAQGHAAGPELTLDLGGSVERIVGVAGGGFLILYRVSKPVGGYDFFTQVFDGAGNPVGDAVMIANSYWEKIGGLALLPSGELVVTWSGGDSSNPDAFGQILSSAGAKLGGEFRLNDATPGSQFASSVAPFPNGNFIASWREGGVLKAQVFDVAGGRVGGELVLLDKSEDGYLSDLVVLSDGTIALLLLEAVVDGNGSLSSRATIQLLDGAGHALGQPVPISDNYFNGDVQLESVPGGGFAVSWADSYDGSTIQLFDNQGGRIGETIFVNADAGRDAGDATLAVNADGDLIVGFASSITNNGIFQGTFVSQRIFERISGPTLGGFGNDTLFGTASGDSLHGADGNDILFLQQGGNDQAAGGSGNDGFYFGAAFDANDRADGGAGADTLVLQGNYAGVSLAGMSNVEVLLVASGSDTRFGDTAGNSYNYHIAAADSNLPAGATLVVNATGLKPGESLAFDGSAESNGHFRIFAGQGVDDLRGGAGNDGFFFGADANLTAADRIAGGAGTDSLALRGNYSLAFDAASFTGVEVLTFLSGHTNEYGGPIAAGGFDYDVTIADGNVAAGALLQVIGVNLRADESLRFDGRAESDGSFRILSGAGDDMLFGGSGNDTIYGALGADQMDGGAGADTYLYRTAQDSTAASRDTIAFGAGDRIDLSLIDADAGTAANEAFTFVGASAFGHHAGELRVFDGGAGQWFVEGDVNGDGNADFVLAVTTAAPLAASDFIL